MSKLSQKNFLTRAFKKNKELHDHLKSQYQFLGTGKFVSTYYDSENDVVIKAFRLSMLKDPYHSKTVSDEAVSLFHDLFHEVDTEKKPKVTERLLRKYIFKTNLKWAEYCCKHHEKNSHLPKIYKVDVLPEYFGYVIYGERLFHTKELNATKIYKFNSSICEIVSEYMNLGVDFKNSFNHFTFGLSENHYQRYMRYINRYEFGKLLKKLSKDFKDYTPDMHSKNIMYRINEKDVTLILNDPFY